jgi:hypothetical protein
MIVLTELLSISPLIERMNPRWIRRLLCGWLALLVVLGVAQGEQEVAPLTGYTRPGWPNDERVGDKIKLVADNPNLREQAIGGTVYFTVLKLTGADDSWGSGLSHFNAAFRPGIDPNGSSSPSLDTKATYLYLYQVVNDRQTEAPIQNISVRLTVDLKEVTSWGYFHGVGFAVPKGEGKETRIRPVSFNNVLGGDKDVRVYQSPAEAITSPQALHLCNVPTKRGEEPPKDDDNQRIVTVIWDALDPAFNPSSTMLLAQSDFNNGPCFRAVWNGDKIIKKDGRSTVFGFTSNLVPGPGLVRIRGLGGPGNPGSGIKPAHGPFEDDATEADGVIGAEGKAASPKTDAPEVESPKGAPPGTPGTTGAPLPPLAGMPPPAIGGGIPLGGSAGGTAPFGGTAGGLSNLGLAASGLGSGGGGSPSSGQTGTNQNAGTTTSPANNNNTETQSQVFNPILINQQTQSQSQLQTQFQDQKQHQQQHQRQHDPDSKGVPGEVVPEPAALWLAVIGLPVLLLVGWRKASSRKDAKAQSQEAKG